MKNDPALNWIDGQWTDSETHNDSHNPATGEVIGTYADGTKADAEKAIAIAKKTFEETDWKNNRHLRSKVLNEMADRFEEYEGQLIDMIALENGKVKGEAGFEFSLVAPKLRYYAALTLTEYGRAMETKPGSFSMVLGEAIGVAGVIAPWNSPLILMIRSLAPALAAGCTVVIKMPAQTAQVNALISKVFDSVESLPDGVIHQITESGNAVAAELIDSPDVPTISYTGSTPTGRLLMKNGAKNLKRFGLELGGKTPMIVFNDANLEATLPVLEKALTTFAGQFCMTGSRILVQSGIADKLRDGLAERLRNVKVGPAAEESSDMGPMIDKDNVERVDKVVEEAIAAGAKVVVRGGPVTEGELAKGAFYEPALLEVSDNKMDIVQEETFGPVATLQVFDTEKEAIALANDNMYGLAASVWSTDVDLPLRVVREIDAGTIWINDWAQVNDEFEEGGYKMSGLGRLNGLAAIHDFIDYKHIFHKPGTLPG